MSWLPMLRSLHSWTTDPPWSSDETAALFEAIRCAPSAHNSQPWALRVRTRSASLRQRLTVHMPEHDPNARDRRISCGAAVANLAVAVRGIGWVPEIRWSVDDEHPNAGATVLGTHRQRVSNADGARWQAITRRNSYLDEFADAEIPAITRSAVMSAATAPVEWVRHEEHVRIAQLLADTARRNHLDAQYQQELAAWIADGRAGAVAGTSTAAALDIGAAAVAGSDRCAGHAARSTGSACGRGRGALLLFSTPGDGPREHFQVGEAAQRVWLEATRLGLVGALVTQPLRIPRVRSGIREALGTHGQPQLIMRLGYPHRIPEQVRHHSLLDERAS